MFFGIIPGGIHYAENEGDSAQVQLDEVLLLDSAGEHRNVITEE